MGARVVAITALEQYGRGSILRTCNLSCLSVSLYPVFDILARSCPLWAAPRCLAVSCPDGFIVPGQLSLCLPPPCGVKPQCAGPLTPRNPPAPSHTLPFSLSRFESDRQAFLSEKQRGEFPIANLLSF